MSRERFKNPKKAYSGSRRDGVRSELLAYYLIITDGKETEKNYLNGLRSSLPDKYRNRIVIKVKVKCTKDLLDVCLTEKDKNARFASMWIMLDRDEVKDFDKLIVEAEKNHIQVAWSNPCLEAWFLMYFGIAHYYNNSEQCITEFKKKYKELLGRDYEKNIDDIYSKLIQAGNEDEAIRIARRSIKQGLKDNPKTNYSDMNPASMVYVLIEEIRNIISNMK